MVRSGLGDVSVADIEFAVQLNAHIYGFGVSVNRGAQNVARTHSVPVHTNRVIYQLMDAFRETCGSYLPKLTSTKVLGVAEVVTKFELNGKGRSKLHAAGCRVSQGSLRASSKFRIKRAQEILHEGGMLRTCGISFPDSTHL